MYGGCLHKFVNSSIGTDVIPNAVDWTNINHNLSVKGGGAFQYTGQQINGINTTIALKINTSGTAGSVTLFSKVVNNSTSYTGSPQSNGFVSVSNNDLISNISNNQWVYFGVSGTDGSSSSIIVRNNSNNDIILDNNGTQGTSFNISASSELGD